jgi:putative ABC transport system substrate-binding protein
MTGILMRPSNKEHFTAMQAVLPRVRHIGLLYHPDRSGGFVLQAKRDAHQLGLTLVASAVREQGDVPETVRELFPQIDLLWVTQDSTVLTQEAIDFLLTSSFDAKVPIYTFAASLVQRGALAGITLNPFDIGQQAGRLARKILHGDVRPHSMLVPPAMTSLALNLNSAEYFGVHPSPEVMRMAGVLFGPGAVAQSDLQWTPVP